MAKKLVKKKKIRIFRVLLILLILGVFCFLFYLYLNTKIKNLIITGNRYLVDDEIIYQAKLEHYPSFYLTFSSQIKKRLLKNPMIKNVKVSREFYHILTIDIEEYQPLFVKKDTGKVVLDNKQEVSLDENLRIPSLMNYIPNTKYQKFIKGMAKIKKDILGKVSEIEYQPNEHDKDRFLLYMDDGNSVYLTLTKFDMLNYYNDVLTQLEGKKGILYLDSGNHFKIME